MQEQSSLHVAVIPGDNLIGSDTHWVKSKNGKNHDNKENRIKIMCM